ncbi:hypothetical protein Lal_00032867 [Lupinus albus]|nr:hypothetical protein Lal_00032867 [Lupinus albus]
MTSQESDSWAIELVSDFDVTSNDHDIQELQSEHLGHAKNTNDSTPYIGQIFKCEENAYNFYCLFAKKCGFSIRRGHCYKCNENNTEYIYRREFICHRAGIVNQQKVNEVEKHRKRKSSRCNCTAKIVEQHWVVTYFSNSHNHALLDDKEVRFLPAYCDIPSNDQSRILLLSKAGCSISIIMRVLELENGIEAGRLPYLEKDIRNVLQSQSSVGNDNDASNVFGDSVRAYEAFGDVVVFDTTY